MLMTPIHSMLWSDADRMQQVILSMESAVTWPNIATPHAAHRKSFVLQARPSHVSCSSSRCCKEAAHPYSSLMGLLQLRVLLIRRALAGDSAQQGVQHHLGCLPAL